MRISLIKSGKVENIIIAESIEAAQAIFTDCICLEAVAEEIGDLYDQATQVFTKPQVSIKKVYTKYEFMARFTTSELAAIYTRANTDPITMVFIKKLELSGEVHSDNPDVGAGLQYLVANSVITQARKDAILA
jgi:hypothetical protein